VVDVLSRRAHAEHIAAINMYMTNLKDKIVVAENSNQNYLKIKDILHQSNFQQKFNSYELKEDVVLMYKG
jgi:hypothetical protein